MQSYHSFLIVSINVLILNTVSICIKIKALVVFFTSYKMKIILYAQVCWNKICLPKQEGGLGMCGMSHFNSACLRHLGWKALMYSSPWAVFFRYRYLESGTPWSPKAPKSGSCIWKRMRNLSHILS